MKKLLLLGLFSGALSLSSENSEQKQKSKSYVPQSTANQDAKLRQKELKVKMLKANLNNQIAENSSTDLGDSEYHFSLDWLHGFYGVHLK